MQRRGWPRVGKLPIVNGHGGVQTMAMTEDELTIGNIPPAFEPKNGSWMRPSAPFMACEARMAKRDDDAGFCPLEGATQAGGSGAVQSGA